jgi:flavin reductase (DIM6/NTAB) family NADH-FMN oxidoreductase RutF
MGVDSASFRRALGQFASGVTVLTARDRAGRAHGLTVSAFCSVSLHPPLVLACVDHRSDANPAIRESGLFAVSVLAEGQEDVSRRFAAHGRAKVEGFAFLQGEHGLPLVPGAIAHLECRVRSSHHEGDHVVWVGEVRALSARPGRPLLHHAGAYGGFAPGGRTGKAGDDRL